MKRAINNWVMSLVISSLGMLSAGCEDSSMSGHSTSQSESPLAAKQRNVDDPIQGEILNDLTRTQLRLAEMKYSDGRADKAIAGIKKTLIDFNFVVLEFERRKKKQDGTLDANQKLLDEISYERAGMSHNDLALAVKQAMKDLENI